MKLSFFSPSPATTTIAATAVNMATLILLVCCRMVSQPLGNRPWKHPGISSASTGQWVEQRRAQQALSSARTQDAGSSRPKVAMSS